MLPDVVGMTQSDAVYVLESKGFAVHEEKIKSDDTEGVVLLMDPVAGSREEEGSEVTIHVSEARTIPRRRGANSATKRRLCSRRTGSRRFPS